MAKENGGEDTRPGVEAGGSDARSHWFAPDAEEVRIVHGRLPGTRYVRIVRPAIREFSRPPSGHLVATEQVLKPRSVGGRAADLARRILIGRRIPSDLEIEERLGKLKGLAVFASDNISSSAYATEEVMRVLILAGFSALFLTMPLTIAIVVILAIVVTSYREVIRAYPNGGGSYVVAHENLGRLAGLAAAAALLTDYILTVAVSVSAGTAAITSAFPELFSQRVAISAAVVVVMTILNLRGVRESGNILAAPTYVYVIAMVGLLGYGSFQTFTGTLPEYSAPPEWMTGHGAEPLALLLVLRAFASGSVALTGTEAVSNGVPAFKPPEVPNAQAVLVAMGALFGTIFLLMSFISGQLGIVPDPEEVETVVSQIARTLVGTGTPYYLLIQFSTAVLLILAANTAFNGFPRLASILARDRYLPRPFQSRGDRLAFTSGIVVLAALSILLIIAYGGSVTGLIPLYTVGVFLAFTLSQLGLVRRWWTLRESGWHYRAAVNGLGATATGTVMVVVGVSKFALGAWMVMVLIPALIGLMWAIQTHYWKVEDALTPDRGDELPQARPPNVVVPVGRVDRAALHALAFARTMSPNVVALHVTDDPADGDALSRRFERWVGAMPLVVVESPYRALVQPIVAYVDALRRQEPDRQIAVVLSEYVPHHFWEYPLHNQTALRLKLALFFRPNTVVVDVPYQVALASKPT
ncbi:MAG: APC family permease [Chloroflexi bacterium]|nr:APC family permease [Chloroflexota bacterium]